MSSWLGALLIAASLSGCTTKTLQAKKIRPLIQRPEAIAFFWASGKGPESISNLPTLSVASLIDFNSMRFMDNYRTEEIALLAAMETAARNDALLNTSHFVIAPDYYTAPELKTEMRRIPSTSAILEMHVQKLVSYCRPGCYSFTVRVNYLAPQSRARVWTSLIEVATKNRHSDSFEPIAQDFVKLLVQSLASEQLLP